MKKPRVSAIAALSKNDRSIGLNNDLLWRIKDDLIRFKHLTTGHPIIMGRKTFESIGKPLPNRTNIVVTRNTGHDAPGVISVHTISKALEVAQKVDQEEIFIIGGGEIYQQALPFTDRLYLTIIESSLTGNVFFPDYSGFKKVIKSEARNNEGVLYKWITLER